MRPSPLLCAAEKKAELEARNALQQLEYLEYLIARGQKAIHVSDVLQLQELAVQDIYPCGGNFRDARFEVNLPDSEHRPPPAALVEHHVRELLDVINAKDQFVTTRAAFALWRFNWIHPFPGGNGRTARAIAYLVLCIDMNMMLPGVPTMPALIALQRDGYIDALRAVDKRAVGITSLDVLMEPKIIGPMDSYLTAIATQQLLNAMTTTQRVPPLLARILVRGVSRAVQYWFNRKK